MRREQPYILIDAMLSLALLADLDKQLILRQSIHKSPRHDNKDFMILMCNMKIKTVCADKGYDSNENHRFVMQDLKAKSLIAIKNYSNKKHRNWKKDWRRVALKQFDEKEYNQRSKVETIFSCVKRKYGSSLRARDFYSQKKEVLCKLVAYNVDRITKDIFDLLRVSAEPVCLYFFVYIHL